AGDGNDRQIIRLDATLFDELPGHRDRYSSSSLGEDALGLREQLYTRDDLRVRHVFGPAAACRNQTGGVIAVRRIPYRQRLRDGRGLDGLDLLGTAFDCGCYGIATGGLRSVQPRPHFFFKEAETLEF